MDIYWNSGGNSPDIDNDNSALNVSSNGNADNFRNSSIVGWNSCGAYTLYQEKTTFRSPDFDYYNGRDDACYVESDGDVYNNHLVYWDSGGILSVDKLR